MTDKKTEKELREENNAASKKQDEADEANRAAVAGGLGTPAELDPNSEASKQRSPLYRMVADGWWHDASHSADATRLAAQRARDEEFGMNKVHDM